MLLTIKAFFSSIGIHIVLLSALLVTFNLDSGKTVMPSPSSNLPEPVIAEVLDAQQVELEVARLQALEDKKRQAEADRQSRLQAEAEAARKKRQAEERRLAEVEKQRKAASAKAEAERRQQQQKQAQLKQQREAEEKSLQELALQKQKEAEENARLAAEKKRLAAEKAQLEAQRAEAERKAKAAEAARKAKEAEAKQRAAEAARRKALENELAAAIAAEENSGEQARDREIYRGLIAQAVQRQWTRPESAQVGECTVRVTQIPGGEVVRVQPQAGRCSGDALFQRSVVKAVEDASPLPAPPNPDVFEREIEFLFRPQ